MVSASSFRFAGATALTVAAHLLVFAVLLWRTTIRQPYSDMISWIDRYLRYRESGGPAGYLLAFHNEHRLLWVRLLTALDVEWLHAGGLPFIVAATIALLATAALLAREAARGASGPALALVPMLVLLSANAVDCSIPVNCVYPLTLLPVVAAVVLFDGPGEVARFAGARRAAAIPVAACAGFGCAVGLLAWPVLLFAAWRARARWPWLLAVLLAAILYCGLYVRGLAPVTAAQGGAVPMTGGSWLRVPDYLLLYLGLPFSRAASLALFGRCLGALLLLAGAYAVLRFGLLARSATRRQRIAVALILFSLGGAALAAVGRVGLQADVAVPARYTVLLAPLHVGLSMLVLPSLERRRIAILAAAGMLFAVQIAGGRAAIAARDAMVTGLARYQAGGGDEATRRMSLPPLEYTNAVLARLRAAGLAAE